MRDWFVKNLGDAMLADEELQRIRGHFESVFPRFPLPDEAALFTRHESERSLHCELKVYFPPVASQVAKAVGAIACKKPVGSGLGMLTGSENAWSIHFSQDKRNQPSHV